MKNLEASPKYLAARDSLPEELRGVYKQLVQEYSFHALMRYGRGWVAYEILADLVRDGWKPSSDSITDRAEEST